MQLAVNLVVPWELTGGNHLWAFITNHPLKRRFGFFARSFEDETTFIRAASRIAERERLVIHQLVRTNGSPASAKSHASNAQPASTNAFYRLPMMSFVGILLERMNTAADFVAGVYPMLLDETCFFLAIDLDKAKWQDDALAVLETCRRLDVPAVLERSRSGNGAHVWIFFETAVPASVARRLGSHVLTETMERRPDIGLDSYDRFFPNQDTLPQGGFGNLIALPLQKQPREAGNSVFVDDAVRSVR